MTKNQKPNPVHQELINRAIILHADLIRSGLYATGHKMHDVVRQIGYEIAEDIQKRRKR